MKNYEEITYVQNEYGFLLNLCTYRPESGIKIGSEYCDYCEYNQGTNYVEQIVKCSFKIENKKIEKEKDINTELKKIENKVDKIQKQVNKLLKQLGIKE